MLLACPKCHHSWNFQGRGRRTECRGCGHFFNNPFYISKDSMQGNIVEALNKVKIDMDNNTKISRDFILLLLDDEKLKFAFSKYCQKVKKKPLSVVKQAVVNLLKEENLYVE